MTLLERTIAAADRRLVLLAPPDGAIPDTFRNIVGVGSTHSRLLREVQRFRGRIYLEDGAIARSQLSPDGLHETPEDERSWHLVSLDESGHLVACAWYRLHDASVSFHQLRLHRCPLAIAPLWRDKLWHAVETDLLRARMEGLGYAELGGWAINKVNRCTSQVLLLACGAYALSAALGGALGTTTATVRHSSARILRRLGGSPLTDSDSGELPAYFDPHYGCMMELLRFDSRMPHPDLGAAIRAMRLKLERVPVVLSTTPSLAQATGSQDSESPQYAA